MRRFVYVGVLAVTLVMAAPGFSQGLRVTGYGSGSFLRAERVFVVDDNSYLSEFDNGGKFGVRATLDVTDSWAIEAGYGKGKRTFSITELDDTSLTPRPYDVNLHEWSGNLKFYFTGTEAPLRPFVTAGTGITVLSPTDEARADAASNDFIDDPASLESSNQTTLSFGAGLESRFSRWLGLRFDLRDHIMKVPRFGLPESSSAPSGVYYPINGAMHHIEASAGVVIHIF